MADHPNARRSEGPRAGPAPSRLARSTALLLGALLLSFGGSRVMAVEEPIYQVVRECPGFELRRYAPTLVAETRVSGDFEEVGNRAFRRLAGFIFGDNASGTKIEMTAPVSQRPAGEAPGATASGAEPRGDYWLSFLMPGRFTRETLPEPKDPSIRVSSEPARPMAARRFSGRWTWERYKEQESALLEAVRAAGLTPVGYPVYARYNAPFVPWFLRRNEVLVEVREPAGQAGAAGC